jgi:LmbE family N-acetylglucosaminyl deacetylase
LNKILIIAAHPDDEILGCGGTIAKSIRKGAVVKILFLGEGSTCRYADPYSAEAKKAIKIRNSWAINALRVLGVSEYKFCNIPCGRFDQTPIIEINKLIENEICTFQPDTVFTHSEGDSNNDHRIVHRATIMATRPCVEHIVKRLLCYEVLSASEWCYLDTFSPNYFVGIDELDLDKKWAALECYESEMREYPFPRSQKGVFNQAMQRGMQSGRNFAEAFQLVREFDI